MLLDALLYRAQILDEDESYTYMIDITDFGFAHVFPMVCVNIMDHI